MPRACQNSARRWKRPKCRDEDEADHADPARGESVARELSAAQQQRCAEERFCHRKSPRSRGRFRGSFDRNRGRSPRPSPARGRGRARDRAGAAFAPWRSARRHVHHLKPAKIATAMSHMKTQGATMLRGPRTPRRGEERAGASRVRSRARESAATRECGVHSQPPSVGQSGGGMASSWRRACSGGWRKKARESARRLRETISQTRWAKGRRDGVREPLRPLAVIAQGERGT